MNKEVVIIGAGSHARVIEEIIQASGDVFLGFLDDNKTGNEIIGTIKDIKTITEENKDVEFIIGIGNNKIRNEIYKANENLKYYTAIHPSAMISKTAVIGDGSAVMANTVINANSVVGANCIINTASIVEHDCIIEEGAHLSYRTTIGAGAKIGKEAYIDIGAIVGRNENVSDYENIKIGEIKGGK